MLQRSPRLRRGAVLVEFAMTVPILFTLLFAGIEFARLNIVRHSVDNAVYEATRAGTLPGASASDVRDVANKVLRAAGIQRSTITIDPPVISRQTRAVSVVIEVPADQVGWIAPLFSAGIKLTGGYRLKTETQEMSNSLAL